LISTGTPKAKAVSWDEPDAERRKRGHKKGLDKSFLIKNEINGVPLDSDIEMSI